MVATHGNEDTIEEMVTLYRNTTHMEEKWRILSFLGASDKEECTEKTLKFAMTVNIFFFRNYLHYLITGSKKIGQGLVHSYFALVHKLGIES